MKKMKRIPKFPTRCLEEGEKKSLECLKGCCYYCNPRKCDDGGVTEEEEEEEEERDEGCHGRGGGVHGERVHCSLLLLLLLIIHVLA
jgi:hypothetical protein